MGKQTKLLVILSILLNIFDAAATLFILSKGGVEVNPVMAVVIDISPWLFVIVKLVVFTFAIIMLAKHRSRWLKWIAGAYGLLAIWHCYLLWNIYLFTLAQLTVN